MSTNQMRAQYTQEFKLGALRQGSAGKAIAVVAKVVGVPKACLGNWVRPTAKGQSRALYRLSRWNWAACVPRMAA